MQNTVEVMDIHDLIILYCGVAGVYLDGLSSSSTINNILFLNLTINEFQSVSSEPVYGIWGKYCEIMNLDNVGTGNTSDSSSCIYGVKLQNSANIRVKSCIASDNISFGLGAIGYDLFNCQSILFLDTAASQNIYTGTTSSGLGAGFHLKNCNDVYFEECTAAGNVSTYTAVGYYFENCTSSGCLKCEALGSASTYGTACGILTSNCFTGTMKGCTIGTNNSGANGLGCWVLSSTGIALYENEIDADLAVTGTAYGILLDNSYSCFVAQNLVVGHVGGSGGFGIMDTLATFSVNRFYGNYCFLNTLNFDNNLANTISIFNGPLSNVIGTFQNASL